MTSLKPSFCKQCCHSNWWCSDQAGGC